MQFNTSDTVFRKAVHKLQAGLSRTAKNLRGGRSQEWRAKLTKKDATLEPWECDGKYRDQCMYNSHPDYSRMCLVPSNYNGSHYFLMRDLQRVNVLVLSKVNASKMSTGMVPIVKFRMV